MQQRTAPGIEARCEGASLRPHRKCRRHPLRRMLGARVLQPHPKPGRTAFWLRLAPELPRVQAVILTGPYRLGKVAWRRLVPGA